MSWASSKPSYSRATYPENSEKAGLPRLMRTAGLFHGHSLPCSANRRHRCYHRAHGSPATLPETKKPALNSPLRESDSIWSLDPRFHDACVGHILAPG
jgi:hypothetical protein